MKARSTLVAAGHRGFLEVGDADAHDVRILAAVTVAPRSRSLEREVGHLAEAFAGTEHGEELGISGDTGFALEEHAEESPGSPSRTISVPAGTRCQWPMRITSQSSGSAKRRKKASAQCGELVGVAEAVTARDVEAVA